MEAGASWHRRWKVWMAANDGDAYTEMTYKNTLADAKNYANTWTPAREQYADILKEKP
jgi:hypothetical protein